MVNRLPGIDTDWRDTFGEQGVAQVLAPGRQAALYDDDEPVTDEELMGLAQWWIEYVSDNEGYRWDYPDFTIYRIDGRVGSAWVVVREDWDEGSIQPPEVVEAFTSYGPAYHSIAQYGFASPFQVTTQDVTEMRS